MNAEGDATRSGLPSLTLQGSRSQVVADTVRTAILSGQLAPGQQLVERELSELFGVSKTPVREALIGLVGTGLVEQNPYRGMVVRTVTPELVQSVYDTRELLEPPAVARSAERIPETSMARASELLDEAYKHGSAGDQVGLQLRNREFHRVLYSSCANLVQCHYLDGLQDLVALISVTGWTKKQTWEVEYEEHRGILAAVTSRDVEAAEARTREHVHAFAAQLLQRFGSEG